MPFRIFGSVRAVTIKLGIRLLNDLGAGVSGMLTMRININAIATKVNMNALRILASYRGRTLMVFRPLTVKHAS